MNIPPRLTVIYGPGGTGKTVIANLLCEYEARRGRTGTVLQDLDVLFAIDRGGVVGPDGATHAGNLDLFPNAEFVVQDEEVHFATGRYMRYRAARMPFEADDVTQLIGAPYAVSGRFIDGDEELVPGITVHLVGGHSRGLQAVSVHTRRGLVVLAAVFIPVLLMGGVIGRLFNEFAVSITAAVLISGFVSLTLTPMLCSRFLRSEKEQKHGRLYNVTERYFDAMFRAYEWSLARVLEHRPVRVAHEVVALHLGLRLAGHHLRVARIGEPLVVAHRDLAAERLVAEHHAGGRERLPEERHQRFAARLGRLPPPAWPRDRHVVDAGLLGRRVRDDRVHAAEQLLHAHAVERDEDDEARFGGRGLRGCECKHGGEQDRQSGNRPRRGSRQFTPLITRSYSRSGRALLPQSTTWM